MSGAAAVAAREPRLRVVVLAAEPEAARLTAVVVGRGHAVVGDAAAADAAVTDGSAPAPARLPAVAIGPVEGDYAGLLPADAAPKEIDAALRAVAVGLIVRARSLAKPRFGPLAEEQMPLLTPREVEVLAAFGDGLSTKETARRLGISPHTVKFHSEQLFRKLGAGSRAEAVAKGLKRQIVEF
jgi:two-component system, NarL family, nitrate/nitrite response regulator NarL